MFRHLSIVTFYRKYPFILFFSAICFLVSAQQNRVKVESNAQELRQFSKQKGLSWAKHKQDADSLALRLKLPVFYTEESGRVILLQRFGSKGQPVYYATDNESVAATIHVNQVQTDENKYPALTGEGIEINLWDGGTVLTAHQEFQSTEGSRITMRDLDLPLSNHSTHISGTMIASGVDAAAKGMAGKALVKAWDLNNDISEMASAAADGILLSNHSYGPLCGWYYNASNESWYWYGDPDISATEDYKFGFYNEGSADLDFIAQNAPYYLIVKSAGNDRNDGPPSTVSHYVWDENWIWLNAARDPDGGTDGFDCLSPPSVAKNVLTIGAVDDARNITAFSAFGPTDDGRIKPDLVSNGADVYSSISTNNTSYATYNGTSMSTASVTGAASLLLQLQNTLLPGVPLRASTTKAILIHSAIDLGNPGPDYSFGWGLVDTKAAADIIYDNSNNQGKYIYEAEIHEGEEVSISVKTPSDAPFLKATLCWTDPAADPSTVALNARTPKLVNDLNLVILSNSGVSFLPWVLDVENPAKAASYGVNHVDNLEQVYIPNPGTNAFTIQVNHSGTLSGGSQTFSLVITGIESQVEIYPPQNLSYAIGTSSVTLNWEASESGTPEKYYIYRNGVLLGESSSPDFLDGSVIFDQQYTYVVTAVYSINNAEFESLGTNEISVFPKTIQPLPYLVDFETETDLLPIKNDLSGWRWGDSETLNSYYLNFSANTTKFIAADSYSAGESVHVSDMAITEPLLLGNYTNVSLSFDYLLKTGIYDAIDELHVVYKKQEETEWHEWIKLERALAWTQKSYALPEEICKNGTQLGFYYDDLYQWGMGAGLDNIYLTGDEEIRTIDLAIVGSDEPVSSCELTENEKVSVTIKNVGLMPALPGDSLLIQLGCSANESINEWIVLYQELKTGEVFQYEMAARLDLSKVQSYTLQFHLECRLDKDTTNNTFEKIIEVFGFPQPVLLTTDLSFCEERLAVLIEAAPEGGILTGAGVEEMYFDPAKAGPGTHLLTYSVINENNCSGEIEFTVWVDSIIHPEILNESLSFCEEQEPVLIEAAPEGGILTGAGVEGMYFDPAKAGPGTHILTYAVTNENDCSGATEFTVWVDSIIHPEILNESLSFCEEQVPILIEAVPEGGTLTGAGVEGMYFDPAKAGPGTHLLTYSVTNENDCNGSTDFTVWVDSIIHPEILNESLSFCEEQVPILIEAVPEGGILTGAGVEGMYFDPAKAGPGTHILTYSVTNENDCSGSTEFTVWVDSIIHPEILNESLSFCEEQLPILIEAVPEGGTLIGVGVEGMYFDPAKAGPGTHILTYSVTNENDCGGAIEFTVWVDSIIHPDILNESLSFCEEQLPILIKAVPEGGTLTGAGVEGMYFDPAKAGPGMHLLTYSVTNENDCSGSTEFTFWVDSIIHPEILNESLYFCEEQLPILIKAVPEGGTLTGAGVEGMYFDPAKAGPGTHLLNYSVTDENDCSGQTEFTVWVDSIIHPEILNESLSFCEEQLPVLIKAVPEGGTLTGAGVEGMYFDPSKAGPGTHLLTYTLNQEFECAAGLVEKEVIVFNGISIDLGADQVIALGDSLELSVPQGNYVVNWFDGSTQTKNRIFGDDLGLGKHAIWVRVSNEGSCSSSDTVWVTVDNPDSLSGQNLEAGILIYPNPTNQGFTVKLLENESIEEVWIFEATGKVVLHKAGEVGSYFDASILKSGVYVVRIRTNKRSARVELLKL